MPDQPLLIDTDELWDLRDDPRARLVDCGGAGAYGRAHIPGSVGLPVHPYVKGSDHQHVMEPDAFGHLMGRLGVTNDHTVVVYDDNRSLFAARMWWVLRYHGHTAVRVLDGGWRRWIAEERPIELDPAPVARASFVARPDPARICLVDDLRAAVRDGGPQILDVRSDEEWEGTESRGNRRIGHVPGASHVEWLNFTRDDHRFKSPDELRAILARAGIEPGAEVVTYCQAGIRAANAAFALTLAGWERARVYDGSMGEWANLDDTPLVV